MLNQVQHDDWCGCHGLDSAAILRHRTAMAARIYQRERNAMQSGKARAGEWMLEFESARAAARPIR